MTNAGLALLDGCCGRDGLMMTGSAVTRRRARLVRACGGLPLALRIVVSLLAADQALTAGELAGDLADEIRRLADCIMTTGAGRAHRRSRPPSSCRTGSWIRRPRGCSGCWRLTRAWGCPPLRQRCWRVCRSAIPGR